MNDLRGSETQDTFRRLALAGVVGPLAFVAFVVAGGMVYDGYSHVDQAISELGGAGAPHAWLQNLAFLVLGTAVMALAAALGAAFPQARGAAVLVGGFGLLACIANAAFPCDASCAGATASGFLHNLTGVAGFASVIAGMVLFARHWRRIGRWRSLAFATLPLAAIAVAGLVTFLAMEIAGVAGVGVPQRVFVGALLVWFVAAALHLAGAFPRRGAALATPA